MTRPFSPLAIALAPLALGCVRATDASLAGAAAPPARPAVVGRMGEPQAGLAPLRRLTREQYANTIRDLLGLNDPVDLPIDEGVGGFYSNVIAPVTELHIEKYRSAAEALAQHATQNLPALVPCDPAGEGACAATFITRFGRRAYRRPLTPAEQQRYQAMFAAARAKSDFRGGIRVVLETMLQSIHFLYRFEPAGAGRVSPLPPHALASRLSYFLWNTMPDETLLAAADAGQLATADQVAAQAARMVADRRFRDGATSFHLQWLGVVELPGKEKRKKIHPLWSEALRDAMKEETVRFIDHVLREGDGRFATLLTSRQSVVGGPLNELYGLGKKEPAAWHLAALDPKQRAGILTQASVMTVHAHWDKPSLVHRGKLIREKLLCETLPPPPPEVNNTLPPADPKVSMRERFEEHRSDVSCAKCHRLIDPLGAPFEMFDAIGNYRTMDGPSPVDSEGEITGAGTADGPVKTAVELVDRLSKSDVVRECFARQWFRFALGREEAPDEAPSLSAAIKAFRESDFRIPSLIVAIAKTDAFRYQQVAP
jgi:hypothetical protein